MSEPRGTMRKKAFLVQWVGLAIAGAVSVVLGHFLPLLAWISAAQSYIQDLGPVSFVAYPLLCALCNLLLLPGGALVVGSGFFFGLWWGFAVAMIGNVLGALVAICLARWIGRSWMERKMKRSARWRSLDEVIAERGGLIVLLSQLHPLFPTSLVNYFYGVSRLPLWTCLGWIVLGQTPGMFFYVYLGTLGQRGLRMAEGKWHPGASETALWLLGLVFTLGVTIALGRLSVRLFKEIDHRSAAQPEAEVLATVP